MQFLERISLAKLFLSFGVAISYPVCAFCCLISDNVCRGLPDSIDSAIVLSKKDHLQIKDERCLAFNNLLKFLYSFRH